MSISLSIPLLSLMVEVLHILQVVRVAESFRMFSTIAVSKFDTSESAGFYFTSFNFLFHCQFFFHMILFCQYPC